MKSGASNALSSAGAARAIDLHRHRFLLAVERIAAADAKFRELACEAENLTGPAQEKHIEDWAIKRHLAMAPARDWWIFGHVKQWLGRLACDPPHLCIALGPDENVDPAELCGDSMVEAETQFLADWYSYSARPAPLSPEAYSASGRFASVSQELPFRVYAYDPGFSGLEDYEDEVRKSFKVYFDDYVRRQPRVPIPEKLKETHYKWLVRYQMLGESFDDIAKSAYASDSVEDHPSFLTVKKAVLDLRNLIALPRRPSGRPRKIVEPR